MRTAPAVLAHVFLVIAAVLVPAVTAPPTVSIEDPITIFDVPKLIVALLAIASGWSALLLLHRKSSIRSVAAIVFVHGLCKYASVAVAIVLVAANLSGSDVWTANMGTFGRLDGAFVIAVTLHLLQLSHALVREGLLAVRNVTTVVITGGSLVALILLMEKSGTHAWGLWFHDISPIANPISTVGNIGALSNLLAVAFVLAVMSTVSLVGRRSWLHWCAAAILAGGLAVHVGRAGVGGALVALTLATAIHLALRLPRWYVPVAGITLLLGTIAIGTVLSSWTAQRSQLFGVLAPGATPDLNLQHRYVTWDLGIRSILANPLIGTGNGSFADQVWLFASREQEELLYTAFLPPHLVTVANRSGRVIVALDEATGVLFIRNAAYDKAHNYFIDVGVAYGLPALLSLATLWATILFCGWRRLRHQPELLTTTIAYLAALQFWFMSINVDPAIYVALGALTATPRPPHGSSHL